MSLVSTVETDPAIIKAVTDAKLLGDTIASDALVFAQSVIGHVSGAAPGIIADVSNAALAAFYDAVPGGIRGTVQAIVGGIAAGTVVQLDATASADVLGALGLVTNRLETWFGEFVPTASAIKGPPAK